MLILNHTYYTFIIWPTASQAIRLFRGSEILYGLYSSWLNQYLYQMNLVDLPLMFAFFNKNVYPSINSYMYLFVEL